MIPPEPYDHVKPVDADVPDGIYRVVGRGEGTVTLLRVADAGERRLHTGEIVTVPLAEYPDFAPAENPDGNRPLGAGLASTAETGYWSLRVFTHRLTSRPFSTAIATLLAIVGIAGDRILPLPDVVHRVLILLGSIGLAYVGVARR
ncbi:hypothetical protein [Halopenitus persicus]|uniref:Uncharacterized protein n=1 Tax=Halopenitus persicus TaxID=1048396 RepID=A0A1H3HRP6_9EURY|nr:hypothetical protein [Halopenitus persicus]QHS15867.1 hypothetical protein GWK26_01170 [haloarchaeon 3A1-DGR]SDY18100.1 hypothetical protein SAMN05216564_103404 [Halopenitus persicus]